MLSKITHCKYKNDSTKVYPPPLPVELPKHLNFPKYVLYLSFSLSLSHI